MFHNESYLYRFSNVVENVVFLRPILMQAGCQRRDHFLIDPKTRLEYFHTGLLKST